MYMYMRLLSRLIAKVHVGNQLGTSHWIHTNCCHFTPPTHNRVTLSEARTCLEELVGASKLFSEADVDRSSLGVLLATDQSELPVKHMSDSYREAYLPLSTDLELRETYLNFNKGMRFGRLLEDLDTFAGENENWIREILPCNSSFGRDHGTCFCFVEDFSHYTFNGMVKFLISYTHNHVNSNEASGQKSPLSIVTAMVDRIDLSGQSILPERDIRFTGNVTWVGKTSMEVTMQIDQSMDASTSWTNLIEAQFLMAARNPINKGPAFICPLQPNNPKEEQIFLHGKENKLLREKQKGESLLRIPPNMEEGLLVHDLFKSTLDLSSGTFKIRYKPPNSIWMEDAILKSVIVCHPQKRNLYGKIFGGYIMRQAFEIAWASASLYSQSAPGPFVIAVDDIIFKKPVEIGSLLFLSSQVVYTSSPYVQVKVHVEVVNPLTHSQETTNMCHFTFLTKSDSIPAIIPKTYIEAMMYLDGKRHFDEAMHCGRRQKHVQ